MAVRSVAVGEPVVVHLAERDTSRPGRPYVPVNVPGVVVAYDERGIHVRFDEPFNGAADCYATYGEVGHSRREVAS